MSADNGILVEYKGTVAIITLNVPKKLNALNGELYYKLARAMHEVAKHDEVYITVLTGNGRFFSAYDLHFAPVPSQLTSPQRRRRNVHRRRRPDRPRRASIQPQILRRKQSTHHTRFLQPPQDPHHSTQRPSSRPIRRSHLLLRLHLRNTTYLPPYAILVPWPRVRRQRVHWLRAAPRHRQGQ
jgi:hypothetical protein